MVSYEEVGHDLSERLLPVLATLTSPPFPRGLLVISTVVISMAMVHISMKTILIPRPEDDRAAAFLFGCCLALLMLGAASREYLGAPGAHSMRGILLSDFISPGSESRRVAIGPAAA